MKQSEVFVESEGDRWHRRNARAVETCESFIETRFLTAILAAHQRDIRTIVEVGCGSGHKLEAACRQLDASGRGFDPSREAVAEGNARLEATNLDIRLATGTADAVDMEDSSADLLIFGFCLYLVDRQDLFAVYSQAHRLVRPGGFVCIVDFDPPRPQMRKYNHADGVYSYKQDYAAPLTASGVYSLVAKKSFSHTDEAFTPDWNERVAITLLYREPQPYSPTDAGG